jgi:hypothetical protein
MKPCYTIENRHGVSVTFEWVGGMDTQFCLTAFEGNARTRKRFSGFEWEDEGELSDIVAEFADLFAPV